MEVRQVVHEAEGVSKVLTGDLGGRRRGDIPPAEKRNLVRAGDGARMPVGKEKEIHSNIGVACGPIVCDGGERGRNDL